MADDLEIGLGETTDSQINTVRPEVLEWEPEWELNRAFRSGNHEVRQLRERVLPKLDAKQSDESYDAYLDQAILYEAASETADAWEGMVFKVAPVFTINGEELDETMQKYLNSVTDTGLSATELLREITDEVITTNRFGVLVDYPVADDEDAGKSRLEQLRDGDFSSCIKYHAESIINWHHEVVNGTKTLVALVLKEAIDNFNFNSFTIEETFQYRVLTLEPGESESGYIYRQRVYLETEIDNIPAVGVKPIGNASSGTAKTQSFELILDIIPTMDKGDGNNGQPLEFIPFWLYNRAGQDDIEVIKEPLLGGITELNKGHFRNSADYENEIHKVSIKSPVIPGGIMDGKDLVMGAPIVTAYTESRPYILETANVSPLAAEMEAKEKRMAMLGAKALGTQASNISEETARIQAAGEESVLGDVATIISEDFSDMLLFKLQWDFGPSMTSATVTLNTDFWENEIDIPDLLSAFGWMQSGGGGMETYFNLLKKRNVYKEGWTMEQEIESIAETQKLLNKMDIGKPVEETVDISPITLDENGDPVIPVDPDEDENLEEE